MGQHFLRCSQDVLTPCNKKYKQTHFLIATFSSLSVLSLQNKSGLNEEKCDKSNLSDHFLVGVFYFLFFFTFAQLKTNKLEDETPGAFDKPCYVNSCKRTKESVATCTTGQDASNISPCNTNQRNNLISQSDFCLLYSF